MKRTLMALAICACALAAPALDIREQTVIWQGAANTTGSLASIHLNASGRVLALRFSCPTAASTGTLTLSAQESDALSTTTENLLEVLTPAAPQNWWYDIPDPQPITRYPRSLRVLSYQGTTSADTATTHSFRLTVYYDLNHRR